jgi:serine/threonine protein kinase
LVTIIRAADFNRAAFIDEGDAWFGGIAMAKIAAQAEKLGWKFLGKNLGRGGQGDVELAVRTSDPDGQRYAFKFLGERGGTKAHERFRQELTALTKVNHASIVKVIEHAQADDGLQYYVMEYVDGAISLRQRISQDANPFHRDPLRAIDGFIQIVEALAECTKFGIVHRDLSPANVLATDDGRVLLIDFGLCHIDGGNRVTVTDEAVGTPHYRPPECTGYSSVPVDIRADLYSAGKIVWSMITNRMAFDREKPVFNDLSLARILSDIPMSWHFHHIFEGTIRHDPNRRFANPANALDKARMARRLIVQGFMPLEFLASETCPMCGVGRYDNATWLFTDDRYRPVIEEFHKVMTPIRNSYAICPYCFHVALVAVEAQRIRLEDRKKLE